MTRRATGTFQVKLTPQPDEHLADAMIGRLTIDKQFDGDIVGTSKGQMLSGSGSVKGSAAYVAIEKVAGSVAGREGTFMLQHTGIMNRGEPSLTITVVPDSGTNDLTGLSGTLAIIIADGKHSYEFDYSFRTE
jgi:hypothetical protein